MSSGMNVEQAKDLASKRNYKWAVRNLKGAYGISYKKATKILLYELAEIADRLVHCKECRWYNTLTKGCDRNPCIEAWYDNDFCSYGERSENE